MSHVLRFKYCFSHLSMLALAIFALPTEAIVRTFVSASGSDLNPCTLAEPCRTIGGALVQTDMGGEVVVLDSGGYGTFTVTQSVSITAPAGVYAVIPANAGADAIVVNAPANARVVLQGLRIHGHGGNDGISVERGGSLYLEHCLVTNMARRGVVVKETAANTHRLFVRHSTIRANVQGGIRLERGEALVDSSHITDNNAVGLGVFDSATTGKLWVKDSVVRNNAQGIRLERGELLLERTQVVDNSGIGIGVYGVAATIRDSFITGTTGAGKGIDIFRGSEEPALNVTIERTLVARNRGIGIGSDAVFPSTAQTTIAQSTIAHNDSSGVYAAKNGSTIILSHNTIVGNGFFGVAQSATSVIESDGRNAIRGNREGQVLGTLTPFAAQ